MREILFRGKREEDSEWAYGDLLHDWQDKGDCIRQGAEHGKCGIFPIDSTTIGQFTGLCDKNGKKIWEGDIIIVNGFGSTKESNYKKCDIAQVFFDYGMFTHGWCEPYLSDDNIVVGNIHDNPDLLNE